MLEGDIHRFPDERLGFVAQLRQDHAFGGGEVDQERKPLRDDAKRRMPPWGTLYSAQVVSIYQ